MKKLLFLISASIFALAAPVLADEYDDLAKDLCNVTISTGQAKIAILPFNYLDKRQSQGGSIVSERLTTRIVKLKKYQVIERELLDNLIKEQHLETSGAVSAETAKQIGQILGVDAIISGTLLDIQDNKVELNARLIKTETAEVLNTASVSVAKIWSDVSNSPPPPSGQQEEEQAPVMRKQAVQEEEQPVYKQAAYARRGPKLDGYVDLFTGLGSGSGNMNVVIDNPDGISGSALGLSVNGSPEKYSFGTLNTNGTAPIGARVGGYGKHWGFDFEMSYFSETVSKQKFTMTLDDGSPVKYHFNVNDYMEVSVFSLLSMDLLYRFTNKMIQPYIGAGIGMTFNTVSSPYITQSGGDALDEFDVGFLLRAPIIGVRVNVGDSTSLFVEQRNIANYFTFTRGYTGENDTVSITASQIIAGVGFKF